MGHGGGPSPFLSFLLVCAYKKEMVVETWLFDFQRVPLSSTPSQTRNHLFLVASALKHPEKVRTSSSRMSLHPQIFLQIESGLLIHTVLLFLTDLLSCNIYKESHIFNMYNLMSLTCKHLLDTRHNQGKRRVTSPQVSLWPSFIVVVERTLNVRCVPS